MANASATDRVVVFLQENKTPDFSFRSLAAFGAAITEYPAARVLAAAPDYDQPHDRNAWVHYRTGDYPAVRTQLDNDRIQPLHAWLAKTFTFCDHHFGIGSNSTSGHLMAIGGQTPTLKNPPFGSGGPTWDMPSIFVHAERAGISWAAVPDQDGYPVKFYDELKVASRAANLHPTASATDDAFVNLVRSGRLPQLTYVWAPPGADEHPPFRASDPGYLARAHDLLWRRIDAVVQAGLWATTTLMLAYDDWGGYADHVLTPVSETAVDARHPNGFALIGGSRLPLILFGGRVRKTIDNTWHSNASIPKTIIDLFGLPAFGVPRVDTAPSLAGFVDPTLTRP
jgi:Phosphoesterase family